MSKDKAKMSKKILKFGQILINFAELLPKKYIKGILAYFRRDVRNYLLRSIFLKKKEEYHPWKYCYSPLADSW